MLKGLGGAKTLFLRSYATYLAGEKRKDEERLEAAGPLGKSDAANRVSHLQFVGSCKTPASEVSAGCPQAAWGAIWDCPPHSPAARGMVSARGM